jgi:beta-fructofuranosidase
VRPPRFGTAAARPSLHFTAARGWINDPHGISVRKGRYHLFYQSAPGSLRWIPQVSWGHATSDDLVTWTQQQSALVPDEDDSGCWSGSVCVEPGDADPALYYTSVTMRDVDRGVVRIARMVDDDWTAWRKGAVVVSPPREPPVHAFRDPYVYWDTDCWRMLVGAGYTDGRPVVLGYRSVDQESWTYEGPALEGPDPAAWRARHAVWECPQLIQVGGRHVLFVSLAADGTTRNVSAAVVDHQRGSLHVDHWSQLTHGPGHYAASAFVDADGNPCVMFWIRGVGDARAGWAGALSIPYRLSLAADRLVLTPHPVLAALSTGPGHALGLTWRPDLRKSSHLSLSADDGRPVLDLLADSRTLLIETPSAAVTAPMTGTSIEVLFDGCLVEIASSGTVVGLPTSAARVVPPVSSAVTPWWR